MRQLMESQSLTTSRNFYENSYIDGIPYLLMCPVDVIETLDEFSSQRSESYGTEKHFYILG